MSKTLLIFLSLLVFSFVNANDSKLDSLLLIFENAGTDKEKANSCQILGSYLIDRDLNESLKWAKRGIKYVDDSNPIEKIVFLNMIGNYHQRTGSRDSAMYFYELAKEIADKEDDAKGKAVIYNNIAIIYAADGDFVKAFDLYLKAMDAEVQLGNESGVAQALLNIAVLYYQQQNLDKTIEYLDRALEIQERLNDIPNIKKSYINIAAIHLYQKEYEKAMTYYQKALELSESLGDRREIALCLGNIGSVYVQLKKFDDAKLCFRRSLAIKKSDGNLSGIAYEYNNLAQFFAQQELKDSSFYYSQKAIEIGEKLKAKYELSQFHKIYAQHLNIFGESEKAYIHLEMSYLYNDSVIQENNTKAITEMEAKYENAISEKTILEQEKQIVEANLDLTNRNQWIGLLSFSFIAILLLSALVFLRIKRQSEKEKAALVLAERDAGMRAVFDAIENERKRIASDLHDGIGQQLSGMRMGFTRILSKIGGKVPDELQDLNKMATVLDQACQEVRTMSHEIMPKGLLEVGLTAAMADMLDKSLRLAGIEFEFDHHNMDDRMKEEIELSLYRVCQEVINNIVKHSGANYVSVQLLRNQKNIVMVIEDNGVGFTKDPKQFSGIGMKTVSSRINSVNGELSLESKKGSGTLISIRIPI